MYCVLLSLVYKYLHSVYCLYTPASKTAKKMAIKCVHAYMYCFVCHIVLPTYPSLDHSPLAIEGRFSNFVFHSAPAVAVPSGVANGSQLPRLHCLDQPRVGVQAFRPRGGGPAVGLEEEQTQDELRQAQQRSPLLLRQEHHPQGTRKEIRVPICLRSRVHARHVVQ